MEIKTRFFGNQTINPDSIIIFPEGIPGFEKLKRYKLFHQEGSDKIYWLQSVDDERLSFSTTQPGYFKINYQFVLTDNEQAILQADETSELVFLVLLHQDENETSSGKQPTVKGSINSPLVINIDSRIGIQKNLRNAEQSIILTEKQNEINVSET
jgi:flagellar assembly factor FliW